MGRDPVDFSNRCFLLHQELQIFANLTTINHLVLQCVPPKNSQQQREKKKIIKINFSEFSYIIIIYTT